MMARKSVKEHIATHFLGLNIYHISLISLSSSNVQYDLARRPWAQTGHQLEIPEIRWYRIHKAVDDKTPTLPK